MTQDRYAHERGTPTVPQCGRAAVSIQFDGRMLTLRGVNRFDPCDERFREDAEDATRRHAQFLRTRGGALLMRALRWIVAIVALAVAVWISAALLGEAYGAGPPYYGRTTNMDKWTSPWPVVLVAAVVVLAIVAAALFPIRSKTRGRPDKEF